MQLASSGPVGSALGRATNKLLFRSIHIPVPRPPAPTASAAQRVAKTTRTLVSRFFAHLTTPGTLRVPVQAGATRGLQHVATRAPGISQGLSLPVRHALSRPLGVPHLPRAPVVPRSVTQVGLGCARAFHSARPVFQALADNVPVGVRALIEADLDLHGAKASGKTIAKMPKAVKKAKRKQMMKENAAPRASSSKAQEPKIETTIEEDMEHYFPVQAIAPVTTHVLIPLAPTPSGRRPLQERPPEYLPMASFWSMHASYEMHSLRVSSLFSRLDHAQVWNDPGVRCSADAIGDRDGNCTLLRITFEGWTEERVRALLGDAGKGWCQIEEVQHEDDLDSVLDARSDGGEPITWDGSLSVEAKVDPAQSLVIPTIDLSTSTIHQPFSMVSSASSSTVDLSYPSSPRSSLPDTDDGFSDLSLSDEEDHGDESLYGLSSTASSTSKSSMTTSWLGVSFSSRFADAMNADSRGRDGPMEYMF
jgi:hypothetical protein